MLFRVLASAGLAIALSAVTALADTQRISAAAGKPALIGVSGEVDPATCQSTAGDANRFVVLTLPANGSVVTALQKVPYKGSLAQCMGKVYQANVLLYTPNRGFKGVDTLSVGHAVTLRDLEMITPVTIEIEVK